MLEIDKARKYKDTNHNAWSLFIKTNHRCNNRKATYPDLKLALDNWTNTEQFKYDCPLYFIQDKDKDKDKDKEREYLEKSTTKKEQIDDKEIICLMGQDWSNEYDTTGECMWYKIVIYDKITNYYYLRSFAKTPFRSGDKKPLEPSRIEGWYVDYSTISAPAEFWVKLKDIMNTDSAEPIETIQKKNSFIVVDKKEEKEKQFWKDLKDIHDRKEFIEVLRKELSDEEIYYLCEKI